MYLIYIGGMNKVLLCKWFDRIWSNFNDLVSNISKKTYCTSAPTLAPTTFWRGISAVMSDIMLYFKQTVGNVIIFKLWKEDRLGKGFLEEYFPSLPGLAANREGTMWIVHCWTTSMPIIRV